MTNKITPNDYKIILNSLDILELEEKVMIGIMLINALRFFECSNLLTREVLSPSRIGNIVGKRSKIRNIIIPSWLKPDVISYIKGGNCVVNQSPIFGR